MGLLQSNWKEFPKTKHKRSTFSQVEATKWETTTSNSHLPKVSLFFNHLNNIIITLEVISIIKSYHYTVINSSMLAVILWSIELILQLKLQSKLHFWSIITFIGKTTYLMSYYLTAKRAITSFSYPKNNSYFFPPNITLINISVTNASDAFQVAVPNVINFFHLLH